jgi:hypothetical protein
MLAVAARSRWFPPRISTARKISSAAVDPGHRRRCATDRHARLAGRCSHCPGCCCTTSHPFVTIEFAQRSSPKRGAGRRRRRTANVDLFGTDGAPPRRASCWLYRNPYSSARTSCADSTPEAHGSGRCRSRRRALEILALAGRRVAFVPGHPMNYKLTTPEDFELARRLAAGG